jgi:hypothetical protein
MLEISSMVLVRAGATSGTVPILVQLDGRWARSCQMTSS